MKSLLRRWGAVLAAALLASGCDDETSNRSADTAPDTTSDVSGDDASETGSDTAPGDAGDAADTPDDAAEIDLADGGDGDLQDEQPPTPACPAVDVPSLDSLAAGHWDDEFLIPGLHGEAPGVRAVAAGQAGEVYVGGLFERAGLTPARNVAVWTAADGWAPLGEGLDGNVTALAMAPDGSLIASSAHWNEDFTENWGQLDVWDGEAWTELARVELPENFEPERLGVLRMAYDSEGRLVVAGVFEGLDETAVANLAVLDGDSWMGLGDAPDGAVLALQIDDDGLCAGGGFTHIGGIEANAVACWDGESWTARDLPVFGTVNALARDGDGALLAGGRFYLSDPSTFDGGSFARWTGEGWELVGRGVGVYSLIEMANTAGLVRDLLVAEDEVFLAGSFTNASGTTPEGVPNVAVSHLAVWNATDSAWNALAGGAQRNVGFAFDGDDVFALASDGQHVYGVGIFSQAGATSAFNAARWGDGEWQPLSTPGEPGSGVHGRLRTLAAAGDCGLYVGGAFNRAGSVVASNVARYHPVAGFEALGSGLSQPVDDLVVDSITGDVLAVSTGCDPETGCFGRVWRFDGAAWEQLGDAVAGALLEVAVGPDGTVWAAGNAAPEGESFGHVFAFDGDAWNLLGGGVDNIVSALHVDDEGRLVVGGAFEHAGEIEALHVARWTGTDWEALGSGLSGPVLSLASYRGRLVAGGQVTARGSALLVAEFDGAAWSEIGAPLLGPPGSSDQVTALASAGDVLYVTGQLRFFGSVAAFDGASWEYLAAMNLFGDTLAITPDGLYVGGGFSLAEGLPTVGLGRVVAAE